MLAAAARSASSLLRFDRADETQRGVQVFRAHGLRPELRDERRDLRRQRGVLFERGLQREEQPEHVQTRFWQRAQQVQCVLDRLAAHGIAIPVELDQVALALEPVFLLVRQREPHRAHRFSRHGAAGAGDAAHREAHICAGTLDRAFGHGAHDLIAHRAVALDEFLGHAEVARLGRVRIADETAVEPVRAAGNVGAELRDPAARAGLRGGEPALRLEQPSADLAGQRRQRGIGWDVHAAILASDLRLAFPCDSIAALPQGRCYEKTGVDIPFTANKDNGSKTSL